MVVLYFSFNFDVELKKPYPSRLVGGAQMWNGLVPHSRVVDKNLGGISWERVVPAKESLTHTRSPIPGFQCQEDKSPQLLDAKTSGD